MYYVQYQFEQIANAFASGSVGGILYGLLCLAFLVFWGWMLVDALRREEYIWAACIFFFSILTALIYFFVVYRPNRVQRDSSAVGIGQCFAGSARRRKIEELQSAIHHLDKPHLYLQLGDVYAEQGKWDKAEEAYRNAYERDAQDEDILSHFGLALSYRGKLKEALPFLLEVGRKNPRHDYGETLMVLAETQMKLGEKEAAMESWRLVLKNYTYARARVQLAQLLLEQKSSAEAKKMLEEVMHDAPFAVKFQRSQDARWVKLAKSLVRGL